MNGKRLRIRARRKKLSEENIEWIAGHYAGCKSGFEQGVIHANRQDALEKAGLLQEIVALETKLAKAQAKIQEQSYLVLDAKRATAAANKKALALEQQVMAQPIRSDWLHVPPFLLRADSAIDKDKLYTNLYGGTVTGRTPGRFPSIMTDAEGGFLTPELSRRMIETIVNRPSILGAIRTVPMRPPGDPIFHWSAEDSRMRDGEPIRELHGTPVDMEEDFRRLNAEAVRAAFRYPFQPSSELRTPEAEEGIRRASARGVTDVEDGHSHTFGVGVDLAAGVTNNVAASVSAEDFQNLAQRTAHLERNWLGVETPEENPSEENVNATGRSDPPGEE